MSDQSNDGRRTQETQIREDERKRIRGERRIYNEPSPNDNENHRSEGGDRGIIRGNADNESGLFRFITESEEYGQNGRVDVDRIPKGDINIEIGDRDIERWQNESGRNTSATEGDRNYKTAHREGISSMGISHEEEEINQGDQQNCLDCQQGGTHSDTSETECGKSRPSYLSREAEEKHQRSSRPKFTSPQEGTDSPGWGHSQYDYKSITDRQSQEPFHAINTGGDRAEDREKASKHLNDINNICSNPFQNRGYRLLPQTIGLQRNSIVSHQEGRLSSERHHSFSTPLLERLSQEASIRSPSGPSGSYKNTNIDHSSNAGETEILQRPYSETMELPNKTGLNCFSTIRGGDGSIGDNIEEVDKTKKRCNLCNKSYLRRRFEVHTASEKHRKSLTLHGAPNHQQPQQSETNHTQPQQQNIDSGIQSILDAHRELAINYDVNLMRNIMAKHIKTINSIPAILQRPIAKAKIKLLSDINSDPSNVSKHVLLIIFSKLVLAAIPYEEFWKTKLRDRKKNKLSTQIEISINGMREV